MGSVLITVEQVKELLNISGSTTYDTFISASIPIVTDLIEQSTFNDFYSSSLSGSNYISVTTKDYPDGLQLPATLLIKRYIDQVFTSGSNSNISSEGIGAYTVTYKFDIPDEINGMLKSYRMVKFK